MQRIVDTKFYLFHQNNSGGYYISNDVVAEFLLVEAASMKAAHKRAAEIVEGHNTYCNCCGERWPIGLDFDEERLQCIYVNTEFDTVELAVAYIRDNYGVNTWKSLVSLVCHYFDGVIEKITNVNAAKPIEVKMTVRITTSNKPEAEPIVATAKAALVSTEDSIVDLKDSLEQVVLSTIKAYGQASGGYYVEIEFEQDGEYIDGEDPEVCYCDLEKSLVIWGCNAWTANTK